MAERHKIVAEINRRTDQEHLTRLYKVGKGTAVLSVINGIIGMCKFETYGVVSSPALSVLREMQGGILQRVQAAMGNNFHTIEDNLKDLLSFLHEEHAEAAE